MLLRRLQKQLFSQKNNIKLLYMETDKVNPQPFRTGLHLRNSLTGKVEEFIPSSGNQVRWYTCGPTVYSNSHLGHARNYTCNDIIRRILRDYLGYDVKLVMNITDIDDKIINKSRLENVQYLQFAKKWERDFFQDMKTLNVEPPEALTRVTEFVPEIIQFIQKIIDNGFGYASNGSVYFDVEKFKEKYSYGKLKRIVSAETEGEEEQGEKRNKADFALWKKAKEGEPTWPSPWSDGRPGWHIECSAMASSIFGSDMDIHSGGVDLIFPHHQNELAQSQAHFCQQHWVRYFIHVGHLHIDKLKMSKSLKNFITIKELLKFTTPRILRLFFAMHQYDKTLNYSPENSLLQSSEKDKRYKNFVSLLRSVSRTLTIDSWQKWEQKDHKLSKLFDEKKKSIHQHILNNFDTGALFTELDEIIKETNVYLAQPTPKLPLLEAIQKYIENIFGIMGLEYGEEKETVNRQVDFMNVLSKFRDKIRANAKTDFKRILEICDEVRDNDLVDLGIRLEDRKLDQASLWKEESKEILLKERKDKQEAIRKKKEDDERKLEKMKIDPKTMFKDRKEYVKFDDDGIPTHQHDKDKDGNLIEKEIAPKVLAKLKKQWAQQKEQHDKYLASQKDK